MWPWGHLAVGYLLYSIWIRHRTGHPPESDVVVLAVATQLPDLIDKPLAWWVGVLPTGRSLGHSLLVGLVFVSAVWWLTARAEKRRLGVAFAIGYLSHLAGDSLHPALAGNVADLTFLVWPLLPLPEYDIDQSVTAHVLAGDPVLIAVELLLVAVAAIVWARDGYPGLGLPKSIHRALTAE